MRILVTGASGHLGSYLLKALRNTEHQVIAWSCTRTGSLFGCDFLPVDCSNPKAVALAFQDAQPQIIVHTAAISSVGRCFQSPELAHWVNVQGTQTLLELAEKNQARFLFTSTDMVFDGEKGSYQEEDATAPLSVYGRTKVQAEQVIRNHSRSLIIRLSLLFAPTLINDSLAFFDQQVRSLKNGQVIYCFEDEWRTPLCMETAASALVALAISEETGILHLGGPRKLSRLKMGLDLAERLGVDKSLVSACSRNRPDAQEPRPKDVSLDSSKWRTLSPTIPWPDLKEALESYSL